MKISYATMNSGKVRSLQQELPNSIELVQIPLLECSEIAVEKAKYSLF